MPMGVIVPSKSRHSRRTFKFGPVKATTLPGSNRPKIPIFTLQVVPERAFIQKGVVRPGDSISNPAVHSGVKISSGKPGGASHVWKNFRIPYRRDCGLEPGLR